MDGSANRFTVLQEKPEEPNLFLRKSHNTKPNIVSRWNTLNSIEEEKNTFKNNKPNNFHRINESMSYNNNNNNNNNNFKTYKHQSTFKRQSRPKTPPPKEFNLENADFPPLG